MSDVAAPVRLRAARAVALAIAVVAFLALAALALSADEGEAELREGAVAPRRTAVTTPGPGLIVDQIPVRPRPAATRPRVATTPTVTTPGAAPVPDAPPVADEPEAPLPVCSLGLPAPERTGGLASMIALVPAFGSFSPEAFAMAPAYEPIVDLFGPLLPTFADVLADNDALVAPVVAALRQLSDAGYTTLEPLYGPYRTDVLAGLRALGAALAPYSEQLAASDAAACLIALEGLLASAGP